MSVIRQIAVFLCGFVMLRMCEAQVPFLGTCPDVGVMADFNPSRYLGKWYEAERYFAVFQLGGRCVTADYNEKDNGVIGVVNKQLSSLKHGRASCQRSKVRRTRYPVLMKASCRFASPRCHSCSRLRIGWWILTTTTTLSFGAATTSESSTHVMLGSSPDPGTQSYQSSRRPTPSLIRTTSVAPTSSEPIRKTVLRTNRID